MRISRTIAGIGLAAAVAAAGSVMLLAAPAHAGTVSYADRGNIRAAATCRQQSFLEGTHLSAVDVAKLAKTAGFTGQDWVVSVAIAEAESSGWTRARLIDTDCSVDRGLWQINSFWHGEVTDACAFNPNCVNKATHTIWSHGGWGQWTTFTNGAYQQHMAEAQAAVNQVSGNGGGGNGGGGGGGTWKPNTAYAVGAQVTYGGHTYVCIQAHTSLPGWEPPNVPSLWRLKS